jgi:hypothetical protein
LQAACTICVPIDIRVVDQANGMVQGEALIGA